MKKVIYYFSGTGNSMRTAIRIAQGIGGAELISVRCGPERAPAEQADVIGFVCPAYEWDLPGAMKKFAEALSINPGAYIFMIVTYIAIYGKSFETMENILQRKKACLNYGAAVRCVASQCTAYTPFPPEKWMIPWMEKRIDGISADLSQRKSRAYPRAGRLTKMLYPKVMTPYLEIEETFDEGFYTDERCVGCGTCAKVCPTQNIAMQERRPVWNHRCHGCMACVAYCPTKAIQFRTPEAYRRLNTVITRRLCLPEKRKRYHNPFIKAADLMADRQYIPGK